MDIMDARLDDLDDDEVKLPWEPAAEEPALVDRDLLRARLEADVAKFHAEGGEVTQCAPGETALELPRRKDGRLDLVFRRREA